MNTRPERRDRKGWHLLRGAVGLASAVLFTASSWSVEPLTTLEYRVQGTGLQVSPAAVAVPKGIAGSVLVTLTGGDATQALADGAYVEAFLRGPGLPELWRVCKPLNPRPSFSRIDLQVRKNRFQVGFGYRQAMCATEARFVGGLEHPLADVLRDRAEARIQDIKNGLMLSLDPGFFHCAQFEGGFDLVDIHNALTIRQIIPLLAKAQFPIPGQPIQPGDKFQQVPHGPRFQAESAQVPDQPEPPFVAGGGVPLRSQRELVGGDQQGERVAGLFERFGCGGAVQDFEYGELEVLNAPGEFGAVDVGAPPGPIVRQHRKAEHPSAELVPDAVVVGPHAPGEVPFPLCLDFDMNEKPLLPSFEQPHFDEPVGRARALGVFGRDLLQLGFEEHGRYSPIDQRVDSGETELQKRPEKELESDFPGRVEFVRHRLLLDHGARLYCRLAGLASPFPFLKAEGDKA